MTLKERVIVEVYTGICMTSGSERDEVYKYMESIMGRPVYPHELAKKEIQEELREKSKADFICLCRDSETPEEQYCYSWDNEHYGCLYDSEEEAIEEARRDNPEAKEVYIAIAEPTKIRWNSNEEQIIESIYELLEDEAGDYAEGALEISTEQEFDLAAMIDETVQKWIDKHNLKPSCYTVKEFWRHVFEED